MDTNTTPEPAPRAGARSEPLTRSRSDRVFAGVAGGIARRIDLPAWLVRVLFVVLSFGGLGVVLYVAGWLLIPEEGADAPIAKDLFGRIDSTAGWVGVALVAIAVLILADNIGFLRGELVLAAVLIVVGLLLYRGDLGRSHRTNGGTMTTEQTLSSTGIEAGPGEAGTADDTGGGSASLPPPTPSGPPPAPPRPPRPPQPRSYLGRATFALGLIVLGAMGLFEATMSSFNPSSRHYLAVALGITGLGLLVGAWAGRARGLIVLGIFLVPALLFSPLADVNFASVGERRFAPDTVSEIQSRYALGIGSLTLDLRDVDFEGRSVPVEVEVGIGELRVWLPDDVAVVAEGRIGIGNVDILGRSRGGVGVNFDQSDEGSSGTVELDLSGNIGQIEVRRRGNAPSTRFGDIDLRITDPSQLQSSYRVDAGNVRLDLAGLSIERFRSVVIDVDTGAVEVSVPDDIIVDVSGHVGIGDLEVFGDRRSGFDVNIERTNRTGSDLAEPLLELTINVDGGRIVVEEG